MPLSSQDQQKLDALKRFFVLDHAPSEHEIGRIVRFAGELFGVKYAFLTLRREDGSENIVAGYGFDVEALPPDAVLFKRDDGLSIPVAVADASQDSRFELNPLVHSEGAARSYAGIPLKSAQGFTLGTLAIMDGAAHELNSEGMAMLANVGALVEPVLQLVQSRREQEMSASSLARYEALSGAAVAAADALFRGTDGFSEALAHLGPAVFCPRAAVFSHATSVDGKQTATFVAGWNEPDVEPLVESGWTFDFESEDLTSWTDAFVTRQPASQAASGPFLTARRARFVAAIPLANGQVRPGFVLLDRASPWSEVELRALQVAFAPLSQVRQEIKRAAPTDVLEACPIPMAVVNAADWKFVFANKAAREMLGLGEGGIETLAFTGHATLADREALASLIANAQNSNRPAIDIHLHDGRGDGRLVHLVTSSFPSDGQSATLLAWIDISEFERREAALVDDRDRAVDATKAKSAFLASMSHEIRTALTSILGYAEFLADELDADNLDMAQTILGSSERLLQTLNSVMDMERLEAEGDSPALEAISLGEMVQVAGRVFAGQAAARNLAFVCEGAQDPAFVWGDQGALTRVLDNLISNALKFTKQGGIRLRVSSAEGGVCLEVQDTGVGIEEDFLPFLFDEFRQEKGHASDRVGGSGLGLALTRRLVDLMGGEIAVTSRKGQGTVFRVTLRSAASPDSSSVGGDGMGARAVRVPVQDVGD